MENIISLLLIILVTQLVSGITIGIKVIVKRGSSVVKEA
ncbi:putative membrane protein [Bacillus mycoides]|nr:putative membrane protein [Bacillus mycoides]